MSGIILAGFLIFLRPIHPTENYTLLQFFSETLPRVSAVFILELLAYFFIHLYRLSLVEDKYYHNETTNLENQYLALKIALDKKNQAMIDACLQKLLATERNPVLDKGQATREILHERNQLSQAQTLFELLRLVEATSKNDGGKTSKSDSEEKK